MSLPTQKESSQFSVLSKVDMHQNLLWLKSGQCDFQQGKGHNELVLRHGHGQLSLAHHPTPAGAREGWEAGTNSTLS